MKKSTSQKFMAVLKKTGQFVVFSPPFILVWILTGGWPIPLLRGENHAETQYVPVPATPLPQVTPTTTMSAKDIENLEFRLSDEYNLAQVDLGDVSPNHPSINAYRYLLSKIDDKCVEEGTEIAQMTKRAHEIFKEKGIVQRVEWTLKDMNTALQAKTLSGNQNTNLDYAAYVAIYTENRVKGKSRKDSLNPIKVITSFD